MRWSRWCSARELQRARSRVIACTQDAQRGCTQARLARVDVTHDSDVDVQPPRHLELPTASPDFPGLGLRNVLAYCGFGAVATSTPPPIRPGWQAPSLRGGTLVGTGRRPIPGVLVRKRGRPGPPAGVPMSDRHWTGRCQCQTGRASKPLRCGRALLMGRVILLWSSKQSAEY